MEILLLIVSALVLTLSVLTIVSRSHAGQSRKWEEGEARRLFNEHQDLVQKFLEIAERRTSVLDDYGQESRGKLPQEMLRCMVKIGERERVPEHLLRKWWNQHRAAFVDEADFLVSGSRNPERVFVCLSLLLMNAFESHHSAGLRLAENAAENAGPGNPNTVQWTPEGLNELSGSDFEVYVANRLKKAGFDDIRGTPTVGDQGVDLLARRGGRLAAIQVKRKAGTVGNSAVQEVVAGRQFYDADEAWVVTNSRFSLSAMALAQKTGVRLVDGDELRSLDGIE